MSLASAARARLMPWLKCALSLVLLTGVALWLDPAALRAAWGRWSPGWLLAALALTLPQVAMSAWRWRFTAARLGAPLGRGQAWAEYYIATFINQVTPGGVAGDAARAWRHGRSLAAGHAAWQAVVIERASGQAVLVLFALAGLAASPSLLASLAGRLSLPAGAVPCAAIALATVVASLWLKRTGLLRSVGRALHGTLFAREVWLYQFAASSLVVASYVAVYACSARMLGIDLPAPTLLPLIPWVLLAMAIPLSVAGWGVREGAAALIWTAAGLDPAQGVAISVTYGLVVLLSSLPGAFIPLWRAAGRRLGTRV